MRSGISFRRTTLLALLSTLALGASYATAAATTLTISGTPPTSVQPGQRYSFTPTVTSTSGRRLRFRISNQPSWAAFSNRRGTLYGSPRTRHVGVYSNIVISVSDGISTAALPPFSITVGNPPTPTPTPTPDPTPTNTPPTISGTPGTAVTVGSAYAFQPSASDANGDSLTFSIANKPTWASFSASTGRLAGTPAAGDAGGYANIVISVSDGQASTALPAFSVTVNPLVVTGSVTLSWSPPSMNTDGTALTNLAGYRISYGASAGALTTTVNVPTAGVTSYTIDNLSQGTWYFAMKTYNSAGAESAATNVVSATVQ
jgi:putative Ig domain-containing protein